MHVDRGRHPKGSKPVYPKRGYFRVQAQARLQKAVPERGWLQEANAGSGLVRTRLGTGVPRL